MDRYQDCRLCGIVGWTESNVPGQTDEQGRHHETFGGYFCFHLPTGKIFKGHLVNFAGGVCNITEGLMTDTDLDFLAERKNMNFSQNYHFRKNQNGIWVGESDGWLDGYSRRDDQGEIIRHSLPARCSTTLMEDPEFMIQSGVPGVIFRGSCLTTPQGVVVISGAG